LQILFCDGSAGGITPESADCVNRVNPGNWIRLFLIYLLTASAKFWRRGPGAGQGEPCGLAWIVPLRLREMQRNLDDRAGFRDAAAMRERLKHSNPRRLFRIARGAA